LLDRLKKKPEETKAETANTEVIEVDEEERAEEKMQVHYWEDWQDIFDVNIKGF